MENKPVVTGIGLHHLRITRRGMFASPGGRREGAGRPLPEPRRAGALGGYRTAGNRFNRERRAQNERPQIEAVAAGQAARYAVAALRQADPVGADGLLVTESSADAATA